MSNMPFKKFEIWVICIFLVINIASFISYMFEFRIMGQNVLNIRVWAYLMLIVFLFTDRRLFVSKSMIIMYSYFLIYLFFEFVGHYDLQAGRPSRYAWLIGQWYLLIVIALAERIHRSEDISAIKIFLRVIVITIFIASIASIVTTIRFPHAVRGAAIAWLADETSIYRKFGLGNLDMFSGLPFSLAVFVFQYKQTRRTSLMQSLGWILLIGTVVFCVYRGAIVAPILVSIVIVFFAILGRERFKTNRILIMTIILVLMLIPRSSIGDTFIRVSQQIQNREIRTKFSDIGTALTSGMDLDVKETSMTTVEGRFSRIPMAIDLFLQSPIIGIGKHNSVTGAVEHVFWFNLLAQFGIIGALPFIWLLFFQIKRNLPKYSEEYAYYYLVTMIAFISLGFIKVLTGWVMFLIIFVFVPNMYYLANPSDKIMKVKMSSIL